MSGHRRLNGDPPCAACIAAMADELSDQRLRENVETFASSHVDYERNAVMIREMSREILKLRERADLAHATRFVFGRFVAVTFHAGMPGVEHSWMVYPYVDGKLGEGIEKNLTQAAAIALARELSKTTDPGH